MNEFVILENCVYHKCVEDFGEGKGICEFSTSVDGITVFKCRQCGQTFNISDLSRDIANYYITRDY